MDPPSANLNPCHTAYPLSHHGTNALLPPPPFRANRLSGLSLHTFGLSRVFDDFAGSGDFGVFFGASLSAGRFVGARERGDDRESPCPTLAVFARSGFADCRL